MKMVVVLGVDTKERPKGVAFPSTDDQVCEARKKEIGWVSLLGRMNTTRRCSRPGVVDQHYDKICASSVYSFYEDKWCQTNFSCAAILFREIFTNQE